MCIHTFTHTYMKIFIHLYTYADICTYVYMYIYTGRRIYVYICMIHVKIYIYVYFVPRQRTFNCKQGVERSAIVFTMTGPTAVKDFDLNCGGRGELVITEIIVVFT